MGKPNDVLLIPKVLVWSKKLAQEELGYRAEVAMAQAIEPQIYQRLLSSVPSTLHSNYMHTNLAEIANYVYKWIISGRIGVILGDDVIKLVDMDNSPVIILGKPVKLLYKLQNLRLFGNIFHLQSQYTKERLKSVGNYVLMAERNVAEHFKLELEEQDLDNIQEVPVDMYGSELGRFVVDFLLMNLPDDPKLVEAMARDFSGNGDLELAKGIRIPNKVARTLPLVRRNLIDYIKEYRAVGRSEKRNTCNEKYVHLVLDGEFR